MRNPFPVAALALLLSAPAFAGTAAQEVQVMDPWAREMPPNMTTTAAFFTMMNKGAADHKLVAAESPAAGMVELHTHINDNGVMRMRPVKEMAVPAGGRTELKPGGLHLMVMKLKHAFKAGDKLPITLVFEDGSKKAIQAEVRRFGMTMGHGMPMKRHMPMQ